MINRQFSSFLIMSIMCFVMLACSSCALAGLGRAKMEIRVIDENGLPVVNANLETGFKSTGYPLETQTDDQGLSVFSAVSDDGTVVGVVKKQGYYFSVFSHSFLVSNFGLLQPWPKKITVVMRPILNPVPMYVRNKWFVLPALNKKIGFDLQKSDWVAPYGQGMHADFVFRIEKRYADIDDFDANMVMSFSNPYDGIQLVTDDGGGIFNTGSQFRLPRTAPSDGYQREIRQRMSRGSVGRRLGGKEGNNYVFRVRSEVDEDGNLVRALYGKVRGEIFMDPRGTDTAEIRMHYYLNPDSTRNLEWDPKRNLSQVPDNEKVEAP